LSPPQVKSPHDEVMQPCCDFLGSVLPPYVIQGPVPAQSLP
jgi:hypothetical protein